jgi:hypothetical protein
VTGLDELRQELARLETALAFAQPELDKRLRQWTGVQRLHREQGGAERAADLALYEAAWRSQAEEVEGLSRRIEALRRALGHEEPGV